MKKIIIALAAAVAIAACLLAFAVMHQEKTDNAVTLDEITFNTTKEVNFKKDVNYSEEHSDGIINTSLYISDNGNDYYEALIVDYSNARGQVDFDEWLIDSLKGEILKNASSQNIGGIDVYSTYRLNGTDVIEPIYTAYADYNSTIVFLSSSDADETVKMISSLKLNE